MKDLNSIGVLLPKNKRRSFNQSFRSGLNEIFMNHVQGSKDKQINDKARKLRAYY